MPGSISVTRTPVPRSSSRTLSPMPVTAHLLALYIEPGMTKRPAAEPVSKTWPLLAFSASKLQRSVRPTPYTLVSSISRQTSGSAPLKPPSLPGIPALA